MYITYYYKLILGTTVGIYTMVLQKWWSRDIKKQSIFTNYCRDTCHVQFSILEYD